MGDSDRNPPYIFIGVSQNVFSSTPSLRSADFWYETACNNVPRNKYCELSRYLLLFLLTLHTSSCADASFGWWMGGYAIYMESVYLTLCS